MSAVNLVVVAHPDDEILGFGGAGAAFAARGEVVKAVICCGGVEARTRRPADRELAEDIAKANRTAGFESPLLGSFPNIRLNTVDHIELVQFIEAEIASLQPTRIFTHHPADLNDDHGQVSRACLAASRLFQRRQDVSPPESVHFMEIQSATDWSLDPTLGSFKPNCFVPIGDHLDAKIEALQCYRGVMRPFPHPRSEECIRGLAAFRGGQSGLEYAEAFQTVFRRGC